MDALLPLALLACPVGMGLMMWFMMRGSGGRRESRTGGDSLPELKAEQARLAEKIDTLGREKPAEKQGMMDDAPPEMRRMMEEPPPGMDEMMEAPGMRRMRDGTAPGTP